eukprot:12425958-Karenia_brevis.AAC.1
MTNNDDDNADYDADDDDDGRDDDDYDDDDDGPHKQNTLALSKKDLQVTIGIGKRLDLVVSQVDC